MNTGISPKWSKCARTMVGNSQGIHCHWCKYMRSQDGYVTCTNKKSRYCDGDRIRTWDGNFCAKRCGHFKLNSWYTKDKNYDITFK